MVKLETFIQEPYQGAEEWREVREMAQKLLHQLNDPEMLRRLANANRPGASSGEIQSVLRGPAEALGFQTERMGLFANAISGLRPDFYLRVGQTGILLEVERGKTTANNMDLLDFWKCHICGHAAYLFLAVPQALRHNPRMTPKKEFETVKRRLKQFFEPGKYSNVRGLCLFGY